MATLPKRSKKLPCGAYETLLSVKLKNYKGYEVYASAEYSELTGKIYENTKLYDVAASDDDDLIDSFKTIKEAHRFIDEILL